MEHEHKGADTDRVVGPGETQERDCDNVMEEHLPKVLGGGREKKEKK